jgi:high-affinity K+ transport system ATPase subunit B
VNARPSTIDSMSEKFVYLVLLGVLLLAGYLVGGVIPMFQRSGRWLALICGLSGAVICFVGQVGADRDHRFFVLAACGNGLQVAGLVSSVKIRKTRRRSSIDLWVPRKS